MNSVFSLETQGKFTEIGAIREFGFFFFPGKYSEFTKTPLLCEVARESAFVWFAGTTPEPRQARNLRGLETQPPCHN